MVASSLEAVGIILAAVGGVALGVQSGVNSSLGSRCLTTKRNTRTDAESMLKVYHLARPQCRQGACRSHFLCQRVDFPLDLFCDFHLCCGSSGTNQTWLQR